MHVSLRELLSDTKTLMLGVEDAVLAHVIHKEALLVSTLDAITWPISQEVASALLQALVFRHPATFAHVLRCTCYAQMICETVPEIQKNKADVLVSVLLHDVGKLTIADDILDHPGELPLKAFEMMKQHAAHGSRILHAAGADAGLVRNVYHHHERMDGYGYPGGLAGSAIPLASRVILVVDTFDAMTSNRPYRLGLPYADALSEMRASRGSQLDGEITSGFVTTLSHRIEAAEKALHLDEIPRVA